MNNPVFETPEMQAIKAYIAAEQQKVSEALRELGDAYARKYSSNFDPEFAPQFDKIFSAQNEINRALADLRRLRGLTLCTGCRAEYPLNAPACPVCSVPNPAYIPPAPAVPVAQPAVCSGCGAPITEGNLFCTNCGKKIDETPSSPAMPAEKFCPGCGGKMPAENSFCSLCGTRL